MTVDESLQSGQSLNQNIAISHKHEIPNGNLTARLDPNSNNKKETREIRVREREKVPGGEELGGLGDSKRNES